MPDKKTLHAIGNAHIDPVWLWRWTEGLEEIRATFRSALDRINEYPDFIFTGSSAAFYAMLEQVEPDMLAEIRKRVSEGRWEIVGGWWVQPDTNVPCGESLVRQALYGQRFFHRALGVEATIGYNPDTFGHPGTLPQILRGAGIDSYIFMRPGPHEKNLPGAVFRWRSPDGSEVLTSRIARAYCTWPRELPDHVAGSRQEAPSYLNNYTVFYGVGNHGGGPTRANLDSLHTMAPEVKLSSLSAYLRAVRGEMATGAEVPVVADELQHHARGCYTAVTEIKRQNRRAEHALMTAERIASVASAVAGHRYPANRLAEAWQHVLFNQFHDILAGSSLPEAYVDARDQLGAAVTTASEATAFAVQAIARQINTHGDGSALVVFNPLPWKTRVPVEIERGPAALRNDAGAPIPSQHIQSSTATGQRRTCFTVDLPALGYRVLHSVDAVDAPATGSLTAEGSALQNDHIRVEVDPGTGWINRLIDRRSGANLLARPASFLAIDDPSDTWSHDVASFRNVAGPFARSGVIIEENGPVRATLRAELARGASRIVQRVSLYRDLDFVEVRVRITWNDKRTALKASFPFAIENAVATAEVPYGSISRAMDGDEHPCQQWIDVSGTVAGAPSGVAILNDGQYGYDVQGAEARLTILRSPVYAHHDPAKLDPAVDYRYVDQGEHFVTLRLVPHAGGWADADITRRAWELNVPPVTINEYAHDGKLPAQSSFASIDAGNVLLTVIKQAEDEDAFVLRAYETAGRPTSTVIEAPAMALRQAVQFKPYQIRTWLFRPGPVAALIPADMLERPSETR